MLPQTLQTIKVYLKEKGVYKRTTNEDLILAELELLETIIDSNVEVQKSLIKEGSSFSETQVRRFGATGICPTCGK